MIQVILNSSGKLTPLVKPPLAKNELTQAKKWWISNNKIWLYLQISNWIAQLPNKFNAPQEKVVVHQYIQFSADLKLFYNQEFEHVLKYLKSTATQGVIMKPGT